MSPHPNSWLWENDKIWLGYRVPLSAAVAVAQIQITGFLQNARTLATQTPEVSSILLSFVDEEQRQAFLAEIKDKIPTDLRPFVPTSEDIQLAVPIGEVYSDAAQVIEKQLDV